MGNPQLQNNQVMNNQYASRYQATTPKYKENNQNVINSNT